MLKKEVLLLGALMMREMNFSVNTFFCMYYITKLSGSAFNSIDLLRKEQGCLLVINIPVVSPQNIC
jgi:hypothetical protein